MVRQNNTSRTKRVPEFLRVFTGTLHNYSERDVRRMKRLVRKKVLNYLIIGYENGDDGTTPHLQLYGQLTKQMRGRQLKNLFKNKRLHIDYRNGTHDQAREYCTKELFEEIGTPRADPAAAGSNNITKHNKDINSRLHAVKDLAYSGASYRELVQLDAGICARHGKFVDKLMSLAQPPIRNDLKISVHFGDPNSGKTFWCLRDSDFKGWVPPIRNSKNGSFWFDSYDGQKAVILDDFSGKFGLDEILRLLDKYPVQVPIKCGHVWFQPIRIYITTNVDPANWYDYSTRTASKQALYRRIHEWYRHHKIGDDYVAIRTDTEFKPLPQIDIALPDSPPPSPTIQDDNNLDTIVNYINNQPDPDEDIVSQVLNYRFELEDDGVVPQKPTYSPKILSSESEEETDPYNGIYYK